jgi:hypothetical protein
MRRVENGYIIAGCLAAVGTIHGMNAVTFFNKAQFESDQANIASATKNIEEADSLKTDAKHTEGSALINLGIAGLFYSAGGLFAVDTKRKLILSTSPTKSRKIL